MAGLLELEGLADARIAQAVDALEAGGVVVFPDLPFALEPDEHRFLDPGVLKRGTKNVSLSPDGARVGGAALDGEARDALGRMLARYAAFAERVVAAAAPPYRPSLQRRRTSFRPGPVHTRVLSPRKDDRRLHLDAFASSPVQGRRILRVFTNVDPQGRPRVWEVGEDGPKALADAFRPSFDDGGLATRLQERLGIVRGRRTAYDAAMLQLHDRAKLDDAWQAAAPRRRISFPAGASWVVFTDGVLHAALEGQHAFEQTWLLPVEAMARPELSPLRALERVAGRALT